MPDTPLDLLVVGLGNPGIEYNGTRHNAGADVAFLLADRHGGRLTFSKRERAMYDDVRIDGKRVVLAFPQTYMNESGVAVGLLARRYDLAEDDVERIVVVHDELDLPTGVVRVKQGGGLAGHNGLRSIKSHLRTDAFLRVRIGIGRPPGGSERGADHVLRRPSAREREELAVAIHEAADAVEMILEAGVDRAMNRYNTKSPAP
ncbi:MAG TPA: aminoacyl-tRNA hydrolase [Acidimicrobiales bacterium]